MALNDKDKAKIEKLKGKRKPLKEKEETFEMKNAFEVYYMMGAGAVRGLRRQGDTLQWPAV